MSANNWISVQESYHVGSPQAGRGRRNSSGENNRYSMRTPPRELSNNVWRVDSRERRGSFSPPKRGTWVMDVPQRGGRSNFDQRYARLGQEDTGATCGGDVCALI